MFSGFSDQLLLCGTQISGRISQYLTGTAHIPAQCGTLPLLITQTAGNIGQLLLLTGQRFIGGLQPGFQLSSQIFGLLQTHTQFDGFGLIFGQGHSEPGTQLLLTGQIGGQFLGDTAQFGLLLRGQRFHPGSFKGPAQSQSQNFQLHLVPGQLFQKDSGRTLIQTDSGPPGVSGDHTGHHRQHGGNQKVANDYQDRFIHLSSPSSESSSSLLFSSTPSVSSRTSFLRNGYWSVNRRTRLNIIPIKVEL